MFDLDGTITRHDTLMSYVGGFLLRHPLRILRLPLVLPALVGFLVGGIDRGGLKAALLRATLGGCQRAVIDTWTVHFVARLLKRGVFADALASIAGHRERGDALALLSASPDVYVPAIGAALGFADVTCTGIAWRDGRLAGGLTTPNRRGTEKVRCLMALRQRHPGLPVSAYGNAASDLEHLRLADQGVLVNGSRRARRAAVEFGVATLTWR